MRSTHKAFVAGQDAYFAGLKLEDCPYKIKRFRSAWQFGWRTNSGLVMPYQVGDIHHLKPDDPWFQTLEKAERHALDKTSPMDCEAVYAIYNEDGDILALVYQGNLYS